MKTVLDKIKIILVGTLAPGNVGSVARAMKNMGYSAPVPCQPSMHIERRGIPDGNQFREYLAGGTNDRHASRSDCGCRICIRHYCPGKAPETVHLSTAHGRKGCEADTE